jgi:nucleotide-binding universal stress UspA family protein
MPIQTSTRVAIRNVAVATDFAACSEHALEHAIAVARRFQAQLHFLHLLRPSQFPMAAELMPALADAADRDYDRLMARLQNNHRLDGLSVHRWVEQGEVPYIAGAFVSEHAIDLLILGTHGRTGLQRLLLGSVAQQIFHSVRCPVLTVGPRAAGTGPQLQLRRVLFATDLSRESLAAVPWALTAAAEWHTALDLLHVCKSGNPAHRDILDRLTAKIAPDLAANLTSQPDQAPGLNGRTPHGEVLSGKASPTILDFAAQHHEDLIVLGLKPQRMLYGASTWSHAYEIVRQAPCPVLSIRCSDT